MADPLPPLAVETRGLTRLFDGKPAVSSLDLQVPVGAFYGFLGPNGAGKSTTMKMLTGLLRPTRGEARVLGVDLARDGLSVKGRIGVVPDGLALFERLSGAEMLRIQGQLYGLDRAVSARRAGELLEAMELSSEGGKLVQDYSHGMKKKLALACALIHGPELLFLDEPFEGIDAVAVSGIRQDAAGPRDPPLAHHLPDEPRPRGGGAPGHARRHHPPGGAHRPGVARGGAGDRFARGDLHPAGGGRAAGRSGALLAGGPGPAS